MTDHDDKFIPEQVDEQIDQFTQNTQHPMNSFIQNMHIVSQDHDDALDRVENNLLDYILQAQKPTPIVLHNTHERIQFMSQVPNFDRPKARSRFITPFTLVACVILAILITGSTLVIFQSAHSRQVHNNNTTLASHKNPTATPNAPPLPSGLCSADSIESWYTICTSRQYTMINQTQTVDHQAVTIYAGYADSNNIILAYSWPLTTPQNNVPLPTLSLSAQKGVTFGGGSGSGEASDDMNCDITSFGLLKVPQNTTSLNITANNGLFHFSLPFHPGRTININKTQVSNGQFVTLESVSISPTMTRIFMKGSNFRTGMPPTPDADPSLPPYQLTAGNWSDTGGGRGFNSNATRANNDPQGPPTGLELDYSSSLVNQKGEWTLTLRNDIVPGATNNITFHFTV
jgi:hypothetical protein